MMSYQNNIPQLRFNGFDGEWETCLLSDVTKYIKGYAFKSEDYQDNGVRIIRVSDLSSDRIKNDVEKVYIDEIKSKIYDKYKLRKGNIVVTTVGSKPEMLESAVGRGIYINNENEGLLNQNMLKFENIKNVNNGFIIGLINTKRYQHYMKSIARGNANQANITVVDLLQYEISFPTLPEQQKIASFLSAVDEKIQQLSRKKELISQYKKGVMQQLFSGKLRFKDENGKDYADWEEKKLGEIAKYYDGTHQTPNYVETGIPFYSVEHVTANQFTKSKYISEEVFEKENKRVKLEKGDILMTRIGDIGTSRLIDWDIKASFYVSLALIKQNDKYNSTFLNQYISSVNFQKELWANTIHVAFPKKINLGEIGKCKIKFPSLPEQQKIANFLSNIDAKIENVTGEIGKTQLFKKGLLQQMFV
ncbi:restriction endonuclease subunit S [Flavobacterium sp. 83]|uniref:restriction endonuclease subunit S n=1 Tax=Flavobacterium sp. 83 TaxID=1131812 RepID=UPI00068D8AF3|nr:restriction endonuclease subunit S [Flavobacterium sp. 83]